MINQALIDYQRIERAINYIGDNFKDKPSKFNHPTGITRLNKFFSLEQVEDDFYLDTVEANHGYFKIPRNLSWGEFEQLTKQVKYNMDMLQFDASIGFIYDHFKAIDMIRIYAENLNIEKLKQIRTKYIERIK